MSVLELRGLHVTYRSVRGDVPAVRGIDLTIEPGETVGLAGESGCGKSTVANAVLRLLPPRTSVEGQVLLDGEDVYAMAPQRLRAVRWTSAAIVFQGALHALNPVQRVGAQIDEVIELHSSPGRNDASRRTGAAARASRAGGEPGEVVSPSAVRRPAPARAHRPRPGLRASVC